MRLLSAGILQQILLLSATMMTDSSSTNVEQASRRLSCLESTAVELTTFSFEYWIAVGSIGSLSVNVLPTLDAYIVGQVEQKIEWCNKVDLMHLLSSNQGERKAAGSPVTESQLATDRFGFGQRQGSRDLSVVSFVHSGLEYPSNCPCAQNPVINDNNTTDMDCHVANGTLYFALCQDNVEYLCPIIRRALEESLAMDTPFMTDNPDLSYLYYYGDNYENSFSQLEICPQPDILTDNIGRRPMPSDSPMASGESNTSIETTPIVSPHVSSAQSPSAVPTHAAKAGDITPEDSDTGSMEEHETPKNMPHSDDDTISNESTSDGGTIQDTPPNSQDAPVSPTSQSNEQAPSPGISDASSSTPKDEQGEQTTGDQTENLDANSSSGTPNQTPSSSNDNVAPSATNETTESQSPPTTTASSGGQTENPASTNSSSNTPSQTPTCSNDNVAHPATNETTESPSPTEIAALLPPKEETTEASTDETGATKDSPSTTTPPASETTGVSDDNQTGPSTNSTEYIHKPVSENPTLMPSNKSHVSDPSPSSFVNQTEIQLPSDMPSDIPSQYPSLIPSAAPTLVASDFSNRLHLSPATYPSVIPSNTPPPNKNAITTPANVESSLPTFGSILPTSTSMPTESASPSSYSKNGGVIVIGPEVGDAVTAPEEDVLVTQSEETDNFMAICLGVGIPILLALLVGGYFAKTRHPTMEKPLAKDVQVVSTLSSLVGTGDPPGSFHEGPFHFMADGTRYLSTRCEECRTTKQNRCFVDNYLRTIHENEIYDDTMSLSLSSESTYSRPVNTHTTSSPTCLPSSLQHSPNVHYCTSATCQKCNSNSPQKQPTTTFVSSPVWAAYPSHQGRLMRSLITEIENEGSFHSDADSDSVISSWDQVRVAGDKVSEKTATTWEEEGEV